MNVQRRRVDTNDAARVFLPSAEATQEIRPEDVLEAVDVEGGVRRARASSGDHDYSSIAPLALDVYADYAAPPAVDTSELRIPMRPPPNPKMLALVGGALGVCILILVGAGIRTAVATTEGGVAVAPTTTAGSPSTPKAAAAVANGAVGVDSLPPAPVSGTIVFPKKANVSLDGSHVTASSAIVRCGDHTVRFGRGATRHVDVPCGGTLDLDKKSR